jgi:hypothetical protein
MSKVIVDEVLRSTLEMCAAPVELCDQSGRLLGHFVPVGLTGPISRPADGCPHSEAELQVLRNQTGSRPLAEIWKSLGLT